MDDDRWVPGEHPGATPLAAQVELPIGKPGRLRQSRAATRAPAAPDLKKRARRAVLRARAGDYEKAKSLLDTVLDGRDRVPLPAGTSGALRALAAGESLPAALRAEATALLAEVTEAADGPEAGRKLLDDGLARWPGDPVLQAVAAVAALRADDLDRARGLVTAALAADPGCAEALGARARLELADDHPEEAIETARALSAARPCVGRALLAIGLGMARRLDEDPGLVDAVLADLPPDTWALEWGAGMLYDDHRFEDAGRVLDHLLQIHPDDADVHWSRGVVRYRLGDYQAAVEDLNIAAARISDPRLTALRGQLAYLTDDYRGAVRLFSSVHEADRPEWVASSLGWSHLRLGEQDAARGAFERALRNDPDDLDAIYGLARLALDYEGEDTATAEKLLRHALELDPRDETAHLLTGELRYQAGQYQEALDSLTEALRLDPKDAVARGYKGVTIAAMGDTEAGIQLLTEAARQDPARESIVGRLAVLVSIHDPGGADSVLGDVQREAEAAGASTLPALRWRGWLAGRQRRWEDAERFYRQARQLAPGDEDLAYQLASALQGLGRPRDGVAVLDELAGPLSAELTEKRAVLLWQSGNTTAARAELVRLPQADHPDPWVRVMLGEMYREEGHRAEARQLLEQVVAEAGDDTSLAVYTLNALGIAEDDDGEPEAARAHLRQALDLQPDYGPALGSLAWLCLNQGDVATVTALLDQSDARMAASPGLAQDPSYAIARSDAFYGLGDYAGALNAVEEAIAESGTGEAGDHRDLLLRRGWAELALGQRSQAEASFLAAAQAPGSPESLIRLVTALTRVDHYQEALRVAARAEAVHNPFTGTAVAATWLRLGAWQAAARYAAPDGQFAPRTAETAYVAARALRMAGLPVKALEYAELAHSISPHAKVMVELAECLSEAGRESEARPLLTDVVDSLSRRVRLDADGMALQGWCLLRLGRTAEAGKVLLRTLSATDKPAKILLDLVLVSAMDDDLRQVSVLIGRARDELARLVAPARCGAMALMLRDLSAIRSRLSPKARELTDLIAAEFRAHRDALGPVLQQVSQGTPFHP